MSNVGRRPAPHSSSSSSSSSAPVTPRDGGKQPYELPRRHRRSDVGANNEWSLPQKLLLAVVVLMGLYAISRFLFPSDTVLVAPRLTLTNQQQRPMSDWLMSKLAVILNDSPRIVTYEDFLDTEQCTYLILLANAERQEGGWQENGAFLWRYTLPYMRDRRLIQIEDRIAEVTSLPAANGEYFWVQQIEPGDNMKETVDAFNIYSLQHQQDYIKEAGQRIIAVYTFLNDIDGGGELYFSKLNITVPAKRGTTVFFHTARPEDGNMNIQIVHHGKTVEGSRDLWVAVKWLRSKDFRANFPRVVVDED